MVAWPCVSYVLRRHVKRKLLQVAFPAASKTHALHTVSVELCFARMTTVMNVLANRLTLVINHCASARARRKRKQSKHCLCKFILFPSVRASATRMGTRSCARTTIICFHLLTKIQFRRHQINCMHEFTYSRAPSAHGGRLDRDTDKLLGRHFDVAMLRTFETEALRIPRSPWISRGIENHRLIHSKQRCGLRVFHSEPD